MTLLGEVFQRATPAAHLWGDGSCTCACRALPCIALPCIAPAARPDVFAGKENVGYESRVVYRSATRVLGPTTVNGRAGRRDVWLCRPKGQCPGIEQKGKGKGRCVCQHSG